MVDDIEKAERAEDITNLWNGLSSNCSSYLSMSNIMRENHINWDGFRGTNVDGVCKNVFSAWTVKAKEMFLNESGYGLSLYSKKKKLIQRVGDDVLWWNKNKGAPTNNKDINIGNLVPLGPLPDSIQENPDLYEEWCNIWLDSGWMQQDERALKNFLVKSILHNNVNIVSKILKDYSIDVNLNITKETHFHLSLKSKYFNPSFHTMKLGFFVRSEQMAKVLSDFGFDWGVKVCDGVPILNVILEPEFQADVLSKKDFVKIIELVTKFNLDAKRMSVPGLVSTVLKHVRESADVEVLLKGVDWINMRGNNGENFLHILAKSATDSKTFKKYAESPNGLDLMNTPDNNGRYPAEYFLCFSCDNRTDDSPIIKMIEDNKIKRPDWLEVKILIAENGVTCSSVDSYKMDIWKQKTPDDFKECLGTKRGQYLIEIATDYYFKYDKPPHVNGSDQVFRGMNIIKYSNPNLISNYFIDCSKLDSTKDEVKLYLIQSWSFFSSRISFMSDDDESQTYESINSLMAKAIDLDIGIAELKSKWVENWKAVDPSNGCHCDYVMSTYFSDWKDLAIIEERAKLQKATRNNGTSKTDRTSVGLVL